MRGNFAPEFGSGQAPMLVRFGGKLVLEVLPAALASAIGAFLFAQYQFGHAPAAGQTLTPAVAVPASAEMLQLVREEHAMIRDFLTAQQTAEKNRAATADAADAQAADAQVADAQGAADATVAAVVAPQPVPPPAATKVPSHNRTIVAAAALPAITVTGARPAPAAVRVLVANAQPDASLSAPPPAAHPSIVAQTLAVPGHVMSVTLHAVMAIGGIPSWFGHRFGDGDLGAAELPSSSAS
jgi:hypothetical protein